MKIFSFSRKNLIGRLGSSSGKNSETGKDWGQKEKGITEDEMAGWHHRLDGHEFE